jgi:alkanesulfonate monooxygenase SsuD/methylene tetrahydromethanopterin reductase-like flavin-dependent oxidoreductase (luciferase family)
MAMRDAMRSATLHHRSATGESLTLELRGQHVETLPELFIGALRERMVTVAARSADGMLLNWVTEHRAARLCALAAANRTERRFTTAAYVPVCVVGGSRAREEAYREVADQLSSYLQLSAYGDLLADDGYAEDVEAVRAARRRGENAAVAVSGRLVEAGALIGTADEVKAGLSRLRAAGIDEPVLAPVTVGADSAASLFGTWAALAE